MSALVSIVGIVGVIISLLFTAWQAGVLARQTKIQNATASASTLQQLFTWLHTVQTLLLSEPKFLPYFRGGEQVPLTSEEEARMKLLAGMYCDVLNIGLHELDVVSSTKSYENWSRYCHEMVEQCPVVAEEAFAKPHGYPRLVGLMSSPVGSAKRG